MDLIMDKVHQKIINEIDQIYDEDQINHTVYHNNNIQSNHPHPTNNHFSYITKFPHFSLTNISKEFKDICCVDSDILSIKNILSIIHPQDIEIVASSYKNACQFILNNYSNLPLGANIFTIQFRIKNKAGQFIKINNTNTLHEELNWNKGFKLFSVCNIISSYESQKPGLLNNDQNLIKESSLTFTARELQILNLLALGKNSYEIGHDLKISKHTVDTHRRKMLAKSKFANTAELIANSISNGLIVS